MFFLPMCDICNDRHASFAWNCEFHEEPIFFCLSHKQDEPLCCEIPALLGCHYKELEWVDDDESLPYF